MHNSNKRANKAVQLAKIKTMSEIKVKRDENDIKYKLQK